MKEQLIIPYDYKACGSLAEKERRMQSRGRRRLLLQRAVLKWLLEHDPPAAMACGVSTRISKYRADVAAFWNHKVRNPHREGPTQILRPHRTLIVECYAEREECWPDCARARGLVDELERWKQRRMTLEEEIRRHEPELRDDDVLFAEYAEWRYEDSDNRDYHRVQSKILQLEQALLKGTRFEKICSSELADQLLLAVPAGVVRPEEMADGWGLLWVHNDLAVEEIRSPDNRECIAENRMHLVQNIAAAATSSVLFANGVQPRMSDRKGQKVVLVQPPRGHRRAKRFRLEENGGGSSGRT